MSKPVFDETIEITTVGKIKKGDFFCIVKSNGKASPIVYVRDDYDRHFGKYYAYRYDDVNTGRLFDRNRKVTQSFIF